MENLKKKCWQHLNIVYILQLISGMADINVLGFKGVPIKYNADTSAIHWLFIKEHSVQDKTAGKPAHRTLFIINVPPYCSEGCLRHILSPCGNVTAVEFHQTPTTRVRPPEQSAFFPTQLPIKGFKVAYVVFDKPSGLQAALRLSSHKTQVLSTSESPVVCGIMKWCKEYNTRIVDPKLLQKDIDGFMKTYDRKADENDARDKQAMEEDSEGWITVTNKGRNPGFSRKESVGKKIMKKERNKRSRKELLNFYTFQIKESKLKHIVNLRQKFEEDKKKINTLKQSRRLRPF